MKTVVVLVAMTAEAQPIIDALDLIEDSPSIIAPPAPCVSFSGSYKGLKVHLVHLGTCKVNGISNVGTSAATLVTYLSLQAFAPVDLIISAGTAGGFKSRGAVIADIFLSTRTINHDRRIPIPKFEEYGIGKQEALPVPRLQRALSFKAGVVSSGNSLDYTDADMKLMEEHQVSVKEMEAAAVAWAASLHGVPPLCVKAITDIVDGDRPAQEEFLENLGLASAALARAVPRVLAWVANKRYSEL